MTGSSIPPQTTRVVATAYGGPEVLATQTVALPEPGPGEVVLEVRAAGVNPIDWKLYSGALGADPDALPRPVGFEASGVAVAVGEGAAGPAGAIAVGDELIGYPLSGAYAGHVVADADAFVPKPATTSFEQAAGVMLAGTTAIHLLEATAVGDGDVVLLHGGSGGVGLIAIQAAIDRGARVIATASERRHDALRALGATPVAYGDGLIDRVRAAAPVGIDASLDAAGTQEALDVSLALVADRDRIATIVAGDASRAAGIKLLGAGPGADPGTELRDAARLQLTDLLARGALSIPTTSRPLSEAADSHRDSIAGHTYGKVVLIP